MSDLLFLYPGHRPEVLACRMSRLHRRNIDRARIIRHRNDAHHLLCAIEQGREFRPARLDREPGRAIDAQSGTSSLVRRGIPWLLPRATRFFTNQLDDLSSLLYRLEIPVYFRARQPVAKQPVAKKPHGTKPTR